MKSRFSRTNAPALTKEDEKDKNEKNSFSRDRKTATLPKSGCSKSRLRQGNPECGIVHARPCFFAYTLRRSRDQGCRDSERTLQRFLAIFTNDAAVGSRIFSRRVPYVSQDALVFIIAAVGYLIDLSI
jgi:hypothetical protein